MFALCGMASCPWCACGKLSPVGAEGWSGGGGVWLWIVGQSPQALEGIELLYSLLYMIIS